MTQIFRRQLATVACLTVAALVCAAPAAGQEEPQPPELSDWERAELQSLVQVVGAARAGELDSVEDRFEIGAQLSEGHRWQHFMLPFTLAIDPAKIDGSSVVVYLFVDDPALAVAAEAEAEENDDADDEVQEAVFEDAYFVQLDEPGADGTVRLSRAFSAPGGEYDVYVALRKSLGEEGADDAREELPVMLLKRQVSVPDLWTESCRPAPC